MKKILIAVVLSLSISACASIKTSIKALNEYTEKDIKDCGDLKCGQDGNPITGKVNSYDENGNLRREITFKNGKEEGISKAYSENGNLMGEMSFKNGKEEGISKLYYENGNLYFEMPYKNGKEEGLAKAYYENGNLMGEIPYKNGKKEGLEKEYYENGNLKREITFKNGKAVSGYLYDEAGKKTKMTNAHLHNLNKDSP